MNFQENHKVYKKKLRGKKTMKKFHTQENFADLNFVV